MHALSTIGIMILMCVSIRRRLADGGWGSGGLPLPRDVDIAICPSSPCKQLQSIIVEKNLIHDPGCRRVVLEDNNNNRSLKMKKLNTLLLMMKYIIYTCMYMIQFIHNNIYVHNISICLKLSAQPYGRPNAKYVHFCTCTRYLMCT